jgi:hypothetical protein
MSFPSSTHGHGHPYLQRSTPPLEFFLGDQFWQWRLEVKQILKVEGLWVYVDGEVNRPAISPEFAGLDHRTKILRASGIIMLCIEPQLRYQFRDDKYDDPRELWAALLENHRKESREWRFGDAEPPYY